MIRKWQKVFSDVGGLLVYAGTAVLALILASWVSSKFMARAVSQTPPEPPAATAPAPKGSHPEHLRRTPALRRGFSSALKNKGPADSPSTSKNPLADIIEDYNYSPKDKRDPFQPFERPHGTSGLVGPLWPLQGFDLDQLHLVGIIWDVKNPKAMITDPNGKGYVVRVNERIGRNNGYIARIREGEIVIVESVTGLDGKISYSTKLIKLQTD